MDITIYLEDGQREEFDKLCEEFGINASQAANIFVNRAIAAKTLPFGYEDEDVRWKRGRFEYDKKTAVPHKKRILTEEDEEIMAGLESAMKSAHARAVLDGTSEMTMEEINAEIAAMRRERREKEALAKMPKIQALQEQSALQKIPDAILEEVGA